MSAATSASSSTSGRYLPPHLQPQPKIWPASNPPSLPQVSPSRNFAAPDWRITAAPPSTATSPGHGRPKTAPPSLGTYYQPPGLKVVAKGDIVFIPAKADNAGNWLTRPTRSASTSHLPYEHPAIVKEVHGKTVILCACTSLDGKTLAEKYPSPHLTFERSRYRFIAHQDNTGEYNHPDNLPELKLDPACSTKQGMTKPCYVNIGDVAECEKWCLRPLRGQGQRMLGLAITQESLGLLDPKAKPATQSQQSRR